MTLVNTLYLLDVYTEPKINTKQLETSTLTSHIRFNVLLDVTFQTGLHRSLQNLHVFVNIEDNCFKFSVNAHKG